VQLTLMRGIVATTEALEVSITHGEQGSIVRLCGRLNLDTSPALRDQLLGMLQAQSPQAVTIDFSDVSYVDSSGIATLIEGLKIARQRRTTLCVRGLEGRVLLLFEATGLSTLLENSDCGSASASKVS